MNLPPQKINPARIRGHELGKPRLTPAGWALVLFYLGVPAMLVGALADFLIQWSTGECVGLWCWLIP